ncbi:hypothetical protein [Streptomyces sp. NPDC055243]
MDVETRGRRLAGVSFCDSFAQVSDRAARVAEIRRRTQLAAFPHAR